MTDSCPSCLRRDCRPVTSRRRGEHVVDGYRCPVCGHQWATARLLTAYSEIHRHTANRNRRKAA